MYEYIKGEIKELNPAFLVLENNGIGYYFHISMTTYMQLQNHADVVQLFVHQQIREDAHTLYGFASRSEREMFRHLISVSGIGATTATVMLSSQNPQEIKEAILTANVLVLKSMKGIGLKTAQRIILDLKDKVGKSDTAMDFVTLQSNTVKDESLSALIALGFVKKQAEKSVENILAQSPSLTVEEVVKRALKEL